MFICFIIFQAMSIINYFGELNGRNTIMKNVCEIILLTIIRNLKKWKICFWKIEIGGFRLKKYWIEDETKEKSYVCHDSYLGGIYIVTKDDSIKNFLDFYSEYDDASNIKIVILGELSGNNEFLKKKLLFVKIFLKVNQSIYYVYFPDVRLKIEDLLQYSGETISIEDLEDGWYIVERRSEAVINY